MRGYWARTPATDRALTVSATHWQGRHGNAPSGDGFDAALPVVLVLALRIARATHAVRIQPTRGTTTTPFDEPGALRADILKELDALTNRFADRPTDPLPELRPLFRAMEQSTPAVGVPRSIELHLDELVNATDTATCLPGLTQAAAREETPR